jgi:hypothetical protein
MSRLCNGVSDWVEESRKEVLRDGCMLGMGGLTG